jgi:hypothetical protein
MLTPGSTERKVFDRSDYIRALREVFVELFVDGEKTINQSSVAKLRNRAREIASAGLVELTHHIPCAVFYEREPSFFKVGLVTFTRFEQFYADIASALSDYHRRCIESYTRGETSTVVPSDEVLAKARFFADRQLFNLREYYSGYDWVASVTIPSCHESISVSRAERTGDAALDVLRLFVPTYSDRYRRANAPNTPYYRHELVTDHTGKIGHTVWREGQGGPAGDGWHEDLLGNEVARKIWGLFGEALECLTKPDKPDELNQLLLDALNWFGQAVVEPIPGAQIVKYAAALERLVMTRHISSGIEALIIRRLALLNQRRTDRTPEQIQNDLGELYEARSNLMHGSISPYDPSVIEMLHIANEATRWSLFNAVELFSHLRHAGKANRRALEFAFEGPKFPHEWLRVAAYYIWDREGRPEGRDTDHWERAKDELIKLWKAGALPYFPE